MALPRKRPLLAQQAAGVSVCWLASPPPGRPARCPASFRSPDRLPHHAWYSMWGSASKPISCRNKTCMSTEMKTATSGGLIANAHCPAEIHSMQYTDSVMSGIVRHHCTHPSMHARVCLQISAHMQACSAWQVVHGIPCPIDQLLQPQGTVLQNWQTPQTVYHDTVC
jgi:hypothetical protein